MEDLKIAVEEPRSWARRLTITVPAERVERARDDVSRTIARRVKLPGFRKGKVPSSVIRQRYGGTIEQQTLERVVGAAYREALESRGFEPISQAEVEEIDYQPGSDLTFNVEFEIQPDIELARLGDFVIERKEQEVGDEEVEGVLERLRQEHAVWEPITDRPAEQGDMVIGEITPVPEEEDEATEPTEPRRYEVVLGQDQILPEIEEALQELAPGEEGEYTAHPRSEDGEPSETPQRIHIRVLEVKHAELPELDDDFAQQVGDFDDMESLRARVRSDLEEEAATEADREVRARLMEQIVAANPFEVPDSMVDRYLDGVLSPGEDADPSRVAEMREAARSAAERGLKRMLVIEHVADAQGLRATEEEIEARIEEIARDNDLPAGRVRSQLEKSGRIDAIRSELTEKKVFEYLKSESTIQ